MSVHTIDQGLDLYLVIGLTKESRHWSSDFIHELQTKLNPKEIHMVDLPGAGRHRDSKSPAHLGKIVDQARSHISISSDRKRVLIAISLGGMVAWEWTTRYPNDFHGMVMINSSMAGVSSVLKRVQPKAILSFLKIAMAKKGSKKEQLILDLCSNHAGNSAKIHPHWTKIGIEADMKLPNVLRQLVAGMRFKPKMVPKIPMLVIASSHDRLAHFSCSKDIAGFANAEMVLCEDPTVGHAFHVDGPEFLAREIAQWWSKLSH